MKRVIAEEEKRNPVASWLDRHEKSPSMIRSGIDQAVEGGILSIHRNKVLDNPPRRIEHGDLLENGVKYAKARSAG